MFKVSAEGKIFGVVYLPPAQKLLEQSDATNEVFKFLVEACLSLMIWRVAELTILRLTNRRIDVDDIYGRVML